MAGRASAGALLRCPLQVRSDQLYPPPGATQGTSLSNREGRPAVRPVCRSSPILRTVSSLGGAGGVLPRHGLSGTHGFVVLNSVAKWVARRAITVGLRCGCMLVLAMCSLLTKFACVRACEKLPERASVCLQENDGITAQRTNQATTRKHKHQTRAQREVWQRARTTKVKTPQQSQNAQRMLR